MIVINETEILSKNRIHFQSIYLTQLYRDIRISVSFQYNRPIDS